ncbi:MAG: SdrD B-like domain-containing protein [Oscillochloridaceae bacterium umkhey_bin13]
MLVATSRRHPVRSLLGSLLVLVIVLGSAVVATPTYAAPILILIFERVPNNNNPVPAGETVRYRLTYECSSSLAADQCTNLRITSQLSPNLEGVQVLGNADTVSATYNPATGVAEWVFASPLPLGTTGQLEFEVRYLPGTTVDGSTGTITSTIIGGGSNPPPVVTTLPPATAADNSTLTKEVTGGGAAGDITNYRLNLCPGPNGSLNLSNVTITDTLPLQAVFVSANPPPSSISGQQLVWTGLSAQVPNCTTINVQVRYPNPPNSVGDVRVNSVVGTGTPFGGTERAYTTAVTHTLAVPAPGLNLDKSADADTIVGGIVTTTLRIQNTGNVELSDVAVEDPIPPEYFVNSFDVGAAIAVEYQKNGVDTWLAVPGPLTANVQVTSLPGFGGTDYISNLRFILGTIPFDFESSAIRIFSTVVNPTTTGVAYTVTADAPRLVTNTATARGVYAGTPITDRTDSATTEIAVPKARPNPQKVIVSGSPALPRQDVRYRLTLNNGSFDALDNPVIVDLLPSEVTFKTSFIPVVTNIPGCAVAPTFTSTPNYQSSGRTLLQWSWAGSGCSIPSGANAAIEFEVTVNPGTRPTGNNLINNRLALVDFSNPLNEVRRTNCPNNADIPETATLVAGGFSNNRICFSPPSGLRVNAAASIGSEKLVRGQLDTVFHKDPIVGQTVRDGLITYQMILTNTGNIDWRNIQIVDVLPFYDPGPPVRQNLGVRDLAVLGTAWTPRLTGPVVVNPPIPGLTIRYSSELNPCRPELAPTNPSCTPMVNGVAPGPGIWSTQLPLDPTAVRSLLFDFGNYQLPPNGEVRFTFNMFAPPDAPFAGPGPDGVLGNNDDLNVAWNTFAYRAVRADDGSLLVAQPPRVGIEVLGTPAGLASYGNYVWNDVDRDGRQDEPAFRGMNGVTVRLYRDADGNPATTGDQELVGTQITRNDTLGNPGYYLFTALQPGFYFAEFVTPPGFTPTTANVGPGDELDSDADPVTGRTAITQLTVGETDLTWDAGFYAPVVSLGNRVWFDTDNDGFDNDGAGAVAGSSTGVAGVTVELFLDANGDGALTGLEQSPIATQATDLNGFYLFDRKTHLNGVALPAAEPLYPAQYIVGLPVSNFTGTSPLVGYHSSGTSIQNNGTLSEAPAPDPDVDPTDRDDNGDTVRTNGAFYQRGVISKPVFVGDGEPLNEPESTGMAPGGGAIQDIDSNLTIDFGFYTTSVGNLVWVDDGAGGGTALNGLREAGEVGLPGIRLRLFSQDNTSEVLVGPDGILGTADDGPNGLLTDANGAYQFGGLPQGSYVVRIFIPGGYVSTRDAASTNNPNGNVDNDDNVVDAGGGNQRTPAFTLTPGAPGTLNNNTVTSAEGRTFNPTLDMGVVRFYSLGNLVWEDQNNNGRLDAGEPGIQGVTLRLLEADATTVARNIQGNLVGNQTTDANGFYRFTGLAAGEYVVEIVAANFVGAGRLVSYASSTGLLNEFEPAPDPDDDVNSDDNGTFDATLGVIRSLPITLGEGTGTQEPTNDLDAQDTTAEAPNNQSNRTLDFGVFRPMTLGNLVWLDANNNGVVDLGETGLDGITVKLFANNGTTEIPVGPDGILGTADDAPGGMLTQDGGQYRFTNLMPGSYIVEITPPAGYRSSTGDLGAYEPAPGPNTDLDNDDNGTTSGAVIRSGLVTLSMDDEPTGEPALPPSLVDLALDENSNLTVDFGLYQPLSLGNLVWRDDDNNGLRDAGEPGLAGITVRLYRDYDADGQPDDLTNDGTPDVIATTTTASAPAASLGYYLFTGLGEGGYVVEIDPLAGYASSTGRTLPPPFEPAPSPDTDVDNDDNGTTEGDVIRSGTVTLSVGDEPLNESRDPNSSDATPDANSNLTVDFGLFPIVSVGNLVWLDQNNNGLVDAGEPGVANVTVRLYRDDDNDGQPDVLNATTGATELAQTTTDAEGLYVFFTLSPGRYLVAIDLPNGYRSSTGAVVAPFPYEDAATQPDPDAVPAVDNDDNGLTDATGTQVWSLPITLSAGDEPLGELPFPTRDDPTADASANYTVDFGLIQPVSLGNLVFLDVNDDGLYAPADGDQPLAGVTLTLLATDGTTLVTSDFDGNPIDPVVTGADGIYGFANLVPGTYRVRAEAPLGYRSSTDIASTPSPDGNRDNDDNGVDTNRTATSNAIRLVVDGEPIPPADEDGPSGNTTLDFGFFAPLSLGDLVFEDVDNNGRFEQGVDTPLSGALVELFGPDGVTPVTDLDDNPVEPQTTGDDGLYLFTNLRPGNYIVRVTAPEGYLSSNDIATTPNPNNDVNNDDNGIGLARSVSSGIVTLTSGGEPINDGDESPNSNLSVDFGFFRPMTLGNLVWLDANNNGLVDGDEMSLDGITVKLFAADGTTEIPVGPDGILGTADDAPGGMLTSNGGQYRFTRLLPGDYIVEITPPAGYRSSTGDLGAYEPAPDPNTDLDNDDNGTTSGAVIRSGLVTLSLGDEPLGEPALPLELADPALDEHSNLTVDFGLYQPLSLGNLVWLDSDNNGLVSPDEPGLGGITVRLYRDLDADGQPDDLTNDGTPDVIATTTTASAPDASLGYYLFTGLGEGGYVVEIVPPAGYASSTGLTLPPPFEPAPSPDTDLDNDDNGTTAGDVIRSGTVTLSVGDEPLNESRDPNSSDATLDANSNLTVDFGLFPIVSVGNLVWLDQNNNGLVDTGEPGVANVTVRLYRDDDEDGAPDVLDGDSGATELAQTTTDANGNYVFFNLSPGRYLVAIDLPEGYRSSTGAVVAPFPYEDAATQPDPDAVPAVDNDDNGLTDATGTQVWSLPITLSAGDEPLGELPFPTRDDPTADASANYTVDFGLIQPVSLGNLAFFDVNDDGFYNPADGDQPLAGVTLTLLTADGTTPVTSDIDGNLIAPIITGADGIYGFANLVPGSYRVQAEAPLGYRSSTDIASTPNPDGNRDNDDNGVGRERIALSNAIALVVNDEPIPPADEDGPSGNTTLDFGFLIPVSLGDLVFEDFANNGIFDPGMDTPLADALVELFATDGTTSVNDFDGNPVGPQTTGADGLYLFTNLRPGSYVVRVTGPLGYVSSTDIATSADPNNDVNNDDNGIGTGRIVRSGFVTLTSGGEPINDGDSSPHSNLTVDFGFWRPAALGDFVWWDRNADGIQGQGEPGVPGVPVILYRPGPDGIPGTPDDVEVARTTTGQRGQYRFDQLIGGDYFVFFDLPVGFQRSPQGSGGTNDSDADANGRTVVIRLQPGDVDLTWDAGIYYGAGLGNRVWLDRDANGIQDEGEPGVPGVRVSLRDGGGVTLATTTTDVNGFYGFPRLAPGTYQIRFDLPEGYRRSPVGQGTDPDADSDADPVTGLTRLITLGPNQEDPTWDAGIYLPVRLGNLVWGDTNNSGVVDSGEAGIFRVPVRLFADANSDGLPDTAAPLAVTQTDANGLYLFDNLTPGRYLVEIVPPAGYVSSTGVNGLATGPFEPAPSPDTDRDNDDNGTTVGTVIRSSTVTLTSEGEPDVAVDGDDRNGNMTVDFGLFRPAALGTTVWFDRDGDGRRGPGEEGAVGVRASLLNADGTPVRDLAGRPITQLTNSQGLYLFDFLIPGSYRVGFSELPEGYTFTTPRVGPPDGDSDADPITGLSGISTLSPGDRDLTIWAGLINPTAISLSSFTGEQTSQGVVLRWSTGYELDTLGFHLWRSSDGTRANAVRITPDLIRAQGGTSLGASYQWLDREAGPGGRYSYWLEELDFAGRSTEYGPISPRAQLNATTRIFIPLVRR